MSGTPYSSLPARTKPMSRGSGLQRTGTLTTGQPLQRGKQLRPVSAKRAAENRRRRAVIAVLYPDRPLCSVPWCPDWADDIHEPLTRGRGGAIDHADNMRPLCRSCHDVVTFTPESELGWAYDLGLLVHSWTKDGAA